MSGESASDDLVRETERQRISRELHSSTSQLVVALKLQVGHLRSCLPPGTAEHLLDEIVDTLQDIHESIKQIGTQRGDDDEAALEHRKVQTAKLFYLLSRTNRASR
jgi:signal transduction histidine kinase